MTSIPRIRNSRFLVPLLLLCAAFFAFPTQAATSFDGELTIAMREERLSGVVWSTITPEHGIDSGAVGTKNTATGARMTNATRTQTGSVTKVVLAVGVLHLVTTGTLSLDADVATLLPQLEFDNPWAASDPVTVRHLLMHTAGLENFRLSQLFSQRARPTTPLAENILAHDGLLRVRTRPGRNYAYSNTGYILLAMVIEAVTGQPYERYMDQSVLAPLGMRDSTFLFRSQQGADADPALAMGHLDDLQPYPVTASFMRPVEQFATTAHDMGLFMQFLLGDGKVGGEAFVSPELLAALAPPQGTEAAENGLETGHGLALAVRDRNRVIAACHPGGAVGFRSMMCIFPQHAKGFFVAFNTDSETADYERFNRLLTAWLAIPAESAVPTVATPIDLTPWRGIYVPTSSGIASLAWIDVLFNATHVGTAADGLLLRTLQAEPVTLVPVGQALFRAADRMRPSHVLFVSEDGSRMFGNGIRSHRQMPLIAYATLWASLLLGVAGLAYMLSAGLWRMFAKRSPQSAPLAIAASPWLLVMAALPFLLTQPFMQLGDSTVGNIIVAVATLLMPCAVLAGILLWFRQARSQRSKADIAALLAALQLLLVLAWWGMLPYVAWH
jgi:CubicO group peptidase (beta-lactamase class C family)